MGEQDKEEFERDFDEILDLALIGLEQPEIIRCKDCKKNPKETWFECPMAHLSEKQRPDTAWCWKGEPMGYESRLYVVRKSGIFDKQNMEWGEVVAVFNLSKGSASIDLRTFPETDVYFYDDSGNEKVIEDRYGDRLYEIPLDDAIRVLEDAAKKEIWNRRYNPCVQMLKAFRDGEHDNLVVLHYGY